MLQTGDGTCCRGKLAHLCSKLLKSSSSMWNRSSSYLPGSLRPSLEWQAAEQRLVMQVETASGKHNTGIQFCYHRGEDVLEDNGWNMLIWPKLFFFFFFNFRFTVQPLNSMPLSQISIIYLKRYLHTLEIKILFLSTANTWHFISWSTF